jgi:putative drug exporter of the RND superfamily
MRLLGEWNWYLPRWLEWLPRLEHGDSGVPVQAPVEAEPARLAA